MPSGWWRKPLRVPGKRVELYGQKSFLEEMAPKKSRVSTLSSPRKPTPVVRQKAMCRVFETRFGNPGPLIISLTYNDEGTKKKKKKVILPGAFSDLPMPPSYSPRLLFWNVV